MQIQSSRATALIQPEAGGRLASLVVDGMEVLVTEGEKITRWGSFPMAPWAGRLGFGRLYFDGALHNFPITSGTHANHGVALRQEWDIVSEAESTATIRTPLADPWPFGGSVEQDAQSLNGFSQTHVVGKDTTDAPLAQPRKPTITVELVVAKSRIEPCGAIWIPS